MRPSRSSRTRDSSSQFSYTHRRKGRTVSRRSEPNSRTTLIGEQPNPWDLLQPQDVISRHRGAKRCRRYELLGIISLLSPAYLLSVERWPFHSGPPDHYDRLSDCARLVESRSQAGLCHCTRRAISDRSAAHYARLRYSLEATAPSQTTHHALSRTRITGRGLRTLRNARSYCKGGSTTAGAADFKAYHLSYTCRHGCQCKVIVKVHGVSSV